MSKETKKKIKLVPHTTNAIKDIDPNDVIDVVKKIRKIIKDALK